MSDVGVFEMELFWPKSYTPEIVRRLSGHRRTGDMVELGDMVEMGRADIQENRMTTIKHLTLPIADHNKKLYCHFPTLMGRPC